ncbi:MAG: molybdenum ABC transporter ATP-binding protein [Gammaproteobacteria bacterium]|nr:molybdenum ABC transporter ATP-binding protein [Gammaproteobacteria bacterium]
MSGGIRFNFSLPLGGFNLKADAEIPGEGVTALFGRSGSGKTSLLRCIAGLEQPATAFLSINGNIWHDTEQGIFVPSQQRAIGYVFQEGVLFPHLRVRENLLFGFKRTPRAQQVESLQRVVDLLGLTDLLNRYPHQLSGGEKQRVAIGRALLNNPRLLLMDEPMASLDRGHKKEIIPYLECLHRSTNIPIVYVTHDPDELVRVADHLVLIEGGQLIAQGPLDEMMARVDLPISRDNDAGAVISARILEHDEDFHLTRIAFKGGELTVAAIDQPLGSDIRIRIHAKDVSLALELPGPTSILNILPARVAKMQAHGRGRMAIQLDVGGVPLLARITQKSRHRLGLEPGREVYAQIKSVALLT